MRDLTADEMLMVSGGDWYTEASQLVKNIYDSIFGGNSGPPPSAPQPISPDQLNTLEQTCINGHGNFNYTYVQGSVGANVKLVNANGSFSYLNVSCTK